MEKHGKIEDRWSAINEAAKPLVDYVNEHCDPHCLVVVRQGSVTLVREEVGLKTKVPD